MGISLKTRKMLWGRSANRCAFPGCRKELVVDATETDDESLIGEECHIIAKKEDGPRGISDLSHEDRNKYSNLILLCAVHHKVIDDQPGEYTSDTLQEMKMQHEIWVKGSLEQFDQQKQKDDEYYASLVEDFCTAIDIDNWDKWTSWVLGSGQPRLSKEINSRLSTLPRWILSRIWPNRYIALENSFHNFRLILQDFLETFHKHSNIFGEDMLTTEKFYQNSDWNLEKYERLTRDYDFHVDLVMDLMVELTRALNYISDNVRAAIFPAYRLTEGISLIEIGPYMDLSYKVIRAEYRKGERTSMPYTGLKNFLEIRHQRDWCFGNNTDSGV